MERDNSKPGFEVDDDGIEIIPFDLSFHTGQGEYTGHKSVYLEGESHRVHDVPNFPSQLNRFFDFLEGRQPESLIDRTTFDQFTAHSIGPALMDFSLQAPNLFKKVLVYREQDKNIALLKARGPSNEDEARVLAILNEPQPVTVRGLSKEDRAKALEPHRQAALRRLHYSRTYQLLGTILKDQDPDFDIKVFST